MNYETWIRLVDEWVYELAGCSVYDLPDCCFGDWHADDMAPKSAARRAIKAAKE